MSKLKSHHQTMLRIIARDYAGRNLCKFIFLTQYQMAEKEFLSSLVYSQENKFGKLNK